jgi:hypothetical protein
MKSGGRAMRKLKISLLIGFGAGVLDIIPMLMRREDAVFSLSAFVHWIVWASCSAMWNSA